MACLADSGFDCDFIQQVPEELTCSVCHFTINDPIQLEGCGHLMCKLCFNQLRDYAQRNGNQLTCPVDRSFIDINRVFEDRSAKRRILNLDVNCSYKIHGCKWTGTLKYLEEHERKCVKKDNIKNSKEDIEELKAKVQQLEIEAKKKDEVINNLNTTVAKLKSTFLKFSSHTKRTDQQINDNKKTIENLQLQVTAHARLNINEGGIINFNSPTPFTYKWLVNYKNLTESIQYSEKFHMCSTNFCFKLSARIIENTLRLYLHRVRGMFDPSFGEIVTGDLVNYINQTYIVNNKGMVISHSQNFTYAGYIIYAGYENSIGYGWSNFLTLQNWDEWITQDRVQIFCKIEKRHIEKHNIGVINNLITIND